MTAVEALRALVEELGQEFIRASHRLSEAESSEAYQYRAGIGLSHNIARRHLAAAEARQEGENGN